MRFRGVWNSLAFAPALGRRKYVVNLYVFEGGEGQGWNSPAFVLLLGRRKNVGYLYALPGRAEGLELSAFVLALDRRKDVGYLYAISKGAKIIYDTDDDNHLFGNIPLLGSSERMNEYALSRGPNTPTGINVYVTYGLRHLWPRGFPLGDIHKPVPRCFQQKQVKPWIQQGEVHLLL
jgi:hypothetical protein